MAITLAVLSSVCFGMALITGRLGLRTLDARSGAAISIPTATVLFVVASPFVFDTSGFRMDAALWFAVVGLFFPAVVTLLTFRSNEELGPTVTSAVSGTAPLFALIAAWLFLHEEIPPQATTAAVCVTVGIVLLSWSPSTTHRRFAGWALFWPIAGAVVRGAAQVAAKAGLLLWSNPLAASLIGYIVSSTTVIAANRVGHRRPRSKLTKQSVVWFALPGILNGTAVVLMYVALTMAAVSTVAPIVAAYPLVTAIASGIALRGEVVSPRMIAGAAVTVAGIVYLVISTTSLG